ncbi:MAG: FeoB-associated Cys-rich membrane protein [Lachnospiraceae bacterium]|nr:FeoB-associated Cys-rich membrane protein [Lachnospiraceae bacterium]
MANIVVIVLIIIALFFSIKSIIKARKNGKTCGCGCSDCSSCAMSGHCNESSKTSTSHR